MRWRHCFAEGEHAEHSWQTFGIGNGGSWLCDGSPLIILRQERDGVWRDPHQPPKPRPRVMSDRMDATLYSIRFLADLKNFGPVVTTMDPTS